MIDPITENIYNIILSIILGILSVVFINLFFDKPRNVIHTRTNNKRE